MKRAQAAFTDDFWRDLLDASDWYDEQQPGAGLTFRQQVLTTTELVVRKAKAYRKIHNEYRRALVSRYRHMVIFVIDGGRVLFVGVVHGMRDLPRWMTRRIDNE